MNKKAYTKPCIKEIYVSPEPISQMAITSEKSSGGGDSKKYDSESGTSGLGIWDSMKDEPATDEEE